MSRGSVCCYCDETRVSARGIVCATKGCQHTHQVTRFGRPTFDNGKWDSQKWNDWTNDPAMAEKVALVLKLEEASAAWTLKYRASTKSKDEYSAQHTVKEKQDQIEDKNFNKAYSARIAAIDENPEEFAQWAEEYNNCILERNERKAEQLRVIKEGIKAMHADEERQADWYEKTTKGSREASREGTAAFHQNTKRQYHRMICQRKMGYQKME